MGFRVWGLGFRVLGFGFRDTFLFSPLQGDSAISPPSSLRSTPLSPRASVLKQEAGISHGPYYPLLPLLLRGFGFRV